MQQDHHDDEAEDQAWRAIVENYGERADLDETTPPPASTAPFGGRFGDPDAFRVPEPEPEDLEPDEEEGYVPPPPPPLPTLPPDRGLAWAGVLGSPIVLLVALVLSISIPSWLGFVLIAGFIGGFLYLVVKMPREPRDPWDDGAQV